MYENETIGGGLAAANVRETEINREYQRLAKAVTELSMTCEGLESAFAPVLRSRLEPVGLETEAAKEPSTATEHGTALSQLRNHVESTTRQVRDLMQRKEI